MSYSKSRRRFLLQTGSAAAAAVLPSSILFGDGTPSRMINFAVIGAGGRGADNILEVRQKNLANIFAGPLTEAVLLGVVAIRTGKHLEWDAANMEARNAPEATQYIRKQYRKGWELGAPG